jgi:hypothetical protein
LRRARRENGVDDIMNSMVFNKKYVLGLTDDEIILMLKEQVESDLLEMVCM